MNLTSREAKLLTELLTDIAADFTIADLRERVGQKIIDLLGAQYFASYIWNSDERRYGHRIAVNMSDANLTNYERHFQFRDPITPVLQKRRDATRVSEIISRERLTRSEFFNDFLARDGLWYGVNYFAYMGNRNVGDMRIWRDRKREDFTNRDVAILNLIGPAYANALNRALLRSGPATPELHLSEALKKVVSHYGLTRREEIIYSAALNGSSDKEIADLCGISFTTVRTHLKHIYGKTGATNRTQLLAKLYL
jgi:DNA-binding CsgD family transcriptional regulator